MAKIPNSLLRTVKVGYIYADGHMVLWHTKRDRKVNVEYDYVTLHKTIPLAMTFGEGVERLVVSKEAIPMLLAAKRAYVRPASIDGGSDATRSRGIEVATIALDFGAGYTFIYSMPDILGGDISVQTKYGEKWVDMESKYYWSDMPINREASTYE